MNRKVLRTITSAVPLIYAILFLGGFIYHTLSLGAKSFDLNTFTAYSLTGILLLAANRFHGNLLDKLVMKPQKADQERLWSAMSSAEKTLLGCLSVFLGIATGLMVGIPTIAVLVPPCMALLGYHDFYGRFIIDTLGIGFLTTTASTLAFFSIWYLLGSAIVHLQICSFYRFYRGLRTKYSC